MLVKMQAFACNITATAYNFKASGMRIKARQMHLPTYCMHTMNACPTQQGISELDENVHLSSFLGCPEAPRSLLVHLCSWCYAYVAGATCQACPNGQLAGWRMPDHSGTPFWQNKFHDYRSYSPPFIGAGSHNANQATCAGTTVKAQAQLSSNVSRVEHARFCWSL